MIRLLFAAALTGLLFSTRVWAEEKQPADGLEGPPFVTAKAWAIADGKTGKVLWGDGEKKALPMASTTKIMTAWIVLELAADDPQVLDESVAITERADKTSGSTAGIETGEQYPVRELMYGLLLPSGNDAAVALAEHFGSRFPGHDGNAEPTGEKQGAPDKNVAAHPADPLELFTAEMNRRAAALEMTQTKYLDPHGNSLNRSSARDLALLAAKALRNPLFREYVSTRAHSCQAKRGDGTTREVTWKNTNQLLGIEGYDGVKTGTTTAAGACLVASARRGEDHLLLVVLGATSPEGRYVDARNLFRWAWRERGQASGGKSPAERAR